MTTVLTGKLQKKHKWENRSNIKEQINMVLQTNKTQIMNAMTPPNDHLHQMTVTIITTSDLAMIVDDHHHTTITPTPKRAVRVAQATTTNTITDKAHYYTVRWEEKILK
jgi:hypothetical protein